MLYYRRHTLEQLVKGRRLPSTESKLYRPTELSEIVTLSNLERIHLFHPSFINFTRAYLQSYKIVHVI